VLTVDRAWGPQVPPGARVRSPWHEGPVVSLACSPDGRTVCSAGRDGRVRVWDLATGELRWQFERRARLVAVSPDATLGYTLTPQGEVWPFDLLRGDEHERLWSPALPLRRGLYSEQATVSGDGRWLFPACDDARGGVVVVDTFARAARTFLAPGAGELQPVGAFTADARSVILLGGVRASRTGRANPALYHYPLTEALPERVRALRTGRQRTLVPTSLHRDPCSLGATWLLVGSAPRMLSRWRVDDNESCDWIELPVRREGPVLTGERRAAFVCERGRAVGVVDHATLGLVGLADLEAPATSLAWSPDETTLLVGTEGGDVSALLVR
jgi:hypothetical protein